MERFPQGSKISLDKFIFELPSEKSYAPEEAVCDDELAINGDAEYNEQKTTMIKEDTLSSETFEGRDEPENPTNGAEEVGCGSEGFIGEIKNRLDIHHMDKECLKNEWTVCIPLVKPPVKCQVADPKAVNNNCVHSNNVNKEFGATSLFQIEVVEHTADKVRYTLLTGRVYAVYWCILVISHHIVFSIHIISYQPTKITA